LAAVGRFLKTAVQRDAIVPLLGVVVVVSLAWLWLLMGVGMESTMADMTRMSGMDGWMMQPAQWGVGYALVMFAMWWVMMIAMMLPSAAPVLLLFAKINRKDKATAAPLIPTGLFALGYLVTWGGFSAMAVALQWQLERSRLLSPMLETTNLWLGAGILLAAGLWQLTPMKAACLDHCRTPLGFLTGNWHAGHLGAFRMGLEHGGWCLGCCWFLMALLFFGGVMNLYWIVGLAVFVLLEKTFPFGHWFGRIAGMMLVGWGVVLLVS
jgi:predicted metal-binding membrane protein